MPQKPLDISTSLFYPRAEEQQASLPGEQLRDANAARIHKSVRVCSHMVHQSTRCKKLQRVFYCNLSKKVQSGAPSGDENSSGPPPVRRAKTPQWGVFRARESPRWCTRKDVVMKITTSFFSCHFFAVQARKGLAGVRR